jgi:hypothetical protein
VRGGVEADAGQLAPCFQDLLGGVGEQGQRRARRDDPAQVGGEAAVQADVEGAQQVAGGERDPVAQVDDPLSG